MFPGPKPRYRLYTKWTHYLAALRDMLLLRFHRGPGIEELESQLCRQLNVEHCISMPMARVGIYLAIKHSIEPDKNVIMSPYTIADVVNMVIAAGGRPLFADIDRQTCNIDTNQVEELIDANTGAVLITHLHGLAAPVQAIQELCDRREIPLIEDAAQAFGARVNNRPVGTFGRAGIFSFGMYKNVNAWYGGAVVTDDVSLAKELRTAACDLPWQPAKFVRKRIRKGLITDFATSTPLFQILTHRVFRYAMLNDVDWINRKVETELDLERHDDVPEHYLARMTPYQARLVLRQLARVERDSLTRISYAKQYHERLCQVPKLVLPPLREDMSHIYTYFPIQYDDRTALIKELMRRHRDIAAQHLKNCASLPAFQEFQRDCPQAEAAANSTILLPTYPRYGNAQVDQTITAITQSISSIEPGRDFTLNTA